MPDMKPFTSAAAVAQDVAGDSAGVGIALPHVLGFRVPDALVVAGQGHVGQVWAEARLDVCGLRTDVVGGLDVVVALVQLDPYELIDVSESRFFDLLSL